MNLREIGWGGMDWIDLALDRDQWRPLVTTLMNLWVPTFLGSAWVAAQLVSSQDGLSSMKLI
jgi:hypothetical protein